MGTAGGLAWLAAGLFQMPQGQHTPLLEMQSAVSWGGNSDGDVMKAARGLYTGKVLISDPQFSSVEYRHDIPFRGHHKDSKG